MDQHLPVQNRVKLRNRGIRACTLFLLFSTSKLNMQKSPLSFTYADVVVKFISTKFHGGKVWQSEDLEEALF